jgi:hypothetical protein
MKLFIASNTRPKDKKKCKASLDFKIKQINFNSYHELIHRLCVKLGENLDKEI